MPHYKGGTATSVSPRRSPARDPLDPVEMLLQADRLERLSKPPVRYGDESDLEYAKRLTARRVNYAVMTGQNPPY